MPKSRLEAFSDAIIAFAITLLILDIHMQDVSPDINNAGMIDALHALVPQFSIYVISFLICTAWWISHHALIHDLDSVDPRLLWLNSLFLMWIAILPFPTGLLGHHPRQPVAILLYGAVCALTSVSFSLMRWYASFRGRLMKKEISATKLRRELRVSLCFPFLYGTAAAAGFVLPLLGLVLYGAIPGVYTAVRLFKYRDHKS